MDGTIYEAATWYDIENNKMYLKKDGENYVADAMLLRESISLRQENESLKKENDSLRKERDHWHVEQVHAYGNWEDAHKRASELEAENAKLKRRLEILKGHGIEIVDAVAGGFEIYNKEHARADRLQDENAKLRKFAKNAYRHICTQEGYLRGSGYDSFDYFDTVARELGIEARDD